ncbi:MAG: hypothetical protein U1U88_000270 [Lawsonella clevelandensis]
MEGVENNSSVATLDSHGLHVGRCIKCTHGKTIEDRADDKDGESRVTGGCRAKVRPKLARMSSASATRIAKALEVLLATMVITTEPTAAKAERARTTRAILEAEIPSRGIREGREVRRATISMA